MNLYGFHYRKYLRDQNDTDDRRSTLESGTNFPLYCTHQNSCVRRCTVESRTQFTTVPTRLVVWTNKPRAQTAGHGASTGCHALLDLVCVLLKLDFQMHPIYSHDSI